MFKKQASVPAGIRTYRDVIKKRLFLSITITTRELTEPWKGTHNVCEMLRLRPGIQTLCSFARSQSSKAPGFRIRAKKRNAHPEISKQSQGQSRHPMCLVVLSQKSIHILMERCALFCRFLMHTNSIYLHPHPIKMCTDFWNLNGAWTPRRWCYVHAR